MLGSRSYPEEELDLPTYCRSRPYNVKVTITVCVYQQAEV